MIYMIDAISNVFYTTRINNRQNLTGDSLLLREQRILRKTVEIDKNEKTKQY